MNLLLAIDGGGTKTDGVLLTEEGRILARARERGCNPNDIGFEEACRALGQVTGELLKPYGGVGQCALLGAFAGISGGTIGEYRQQFRDFFQKLLPGCRTVEIHSDAVTALSSCIGHQDGCVVISGTGSAAYARQGEALFRAGGWGYLLDKGGSGYDFGRDVLYYSLCAADGRGRDTILRRLAEEKLEMPVGDGVGEIYRRGKPFIASFAPLAFEGLRLGDWAAREILERNVRELARLLNAVGNRFPGGERPVRTGLAGGLFQEFSWMEPVLLPLLDRRHEFIRPQLPPVFGSAVEVMAAAGLEPGPEFFQNFQESLNCCPCREKEI